MLKEKQPNKEQLEAIEHFKGPAIVIAGPGTGKTYVIQKRVENLIKKHKVKPENILVTTFTEKAADELKFRILSNLRNVENIENIHISTLHSLCETILKQYGDFHKFGFDFEVMDEIGEAIFIEKYAFKLGLKRNKKSPGLINLIKKEWNKTKTQTILNFFNRCIENNVDPDELVKYYENDKNSKEYLAAKAYRRFIRTMEEYQIINFSNLQRECLKLIRNNKQVADDIRQRFQFIIVDEYQDINPIQALIIDEISKPNYNLFVVGDEDQSIYGFRGADIEQFRSFTKRYKNAKEYKLKINYRATKNLVNHSEHFIKNHRKIEKKIVAKNPEKIEPILLLSRNQLEEEENIAKLLVMLKENNIVDSYSDIAILMRKNDHIYKITQWLDKYKIKYTVGRHNASKHWLFEDIMRLMKYVYAPHENLGYVSKMAKGRGVSWWEKDLLTSKILDLSEKTVLALSDFKSDLHNVELEELLKLGVTKDDANKIIRLNTISRNAKKKGMLETFYNILELGNILREKIKKIEDNTLTSEDKKDLKILSILSKFLYNYDSIAGKASFSLLMGAIINALDIDSVFYYEFNEDSGVNIMTVHQAKGLEFPIVIIPHASEFKIKKETKSDLAIPKKFLINKESDSEEEFRVFYVGMTRSKDILIITDNNETKSKNTVTNDLNYDAIIRFYDPDNLVKSLKASIKEIRRNENKDEYLAHFSYSSIKTYLDCPLRYNLIYVNEIKTPRIFQQLKGIMYHLLLYKINKKFMETGDIDNDTIERIISETFDTLHIPKNSGINKDKVYSSVKKYWQTFLNKKVDRIIDIERYFTYKIREKRALVNGRYDMLYVDKDLGTVLVDFKAQTKKGIEAVGLKYQFGVYYLALDNEYPELKFAAYTIEDGEFIEFNTEEIKSLEMESIIKERVIKSIENEFFKHKKNKFCKSCEFRHFCGVDLNES